jgi:uncharacterized membrane protein YsdA (DUF1294 family)
MQSLQQLVTGFFFLYPILINISAYYAMRWDKNRAKEGDWRVSEVTLLFLAFVGGALGLFAGMYKFRHKTRKRLFQAAAFIALFPTLVIWWFMYWIIFGVVY